MIYLNYIYWSSIDDKPFLIDSDHQLCSDQYQYYEFDFINLDIHIFGSKWYWNIHDLSLSLNTIS